MEADLSIGPPTAPEVEAAPGAIEDDAPLFDELDAGPVQPVNETQLRDMLDGLGRSASLAVNFGVPGLWRFTKEELDGLVPPLTRIVNNRPALARAVHKGDTVMVALQLSAYAGRRADAVRAVRRAQREDDHGDGEREADRDAAGGDAAAGGFAGGWGSRYANGSGSATAEP